MNKNNISEQTNIDDAIIDLITIPGVGRSIANDLWNINIKKVTDLKNKDPEVLFMKSNQFAGCVQDRCLLYVFRCTVYFAETNDVNRDPERLKWWKWKDMK